MSLIVCFAFERKRKGHTTERVILYRRTLTAHWLRRRRQPGVDRRRLRTATAPRAALGSSPPVGQGGVGGGVSQGVGLDPNVPPASVLPFKKMDTAVYLIIFIFCDMCPTPLLPWTARFIYD